MVEWIKNYYDNNGVNVEDNNEGSIRIGKFLNLYISSPLLEGQYKIVGTLKILFPDGDIRYASYEHNLDEEPKSSLLNEMNSDLETIIQYKDEWLELLHELNIVGMKRINAKISTIE